MNITGEHAIYINNLIFTYAPVGSDDIRGVVINGSLYFIVNFGLLYAIDMPGFPKDITCGFNRNFENAYSFYSNDLIIDNPQVTNEVLCKISPLLSIACSCAPIYINENLRNDEDFDTILNLKSGIGCDKYYVNTDLNHKSFVTISKSMFKLNKPDTISLFIYNCSADKLLYQFKMHKKKLNLDVNLYIMTCDVH